MWGKSMQVMNLGQRRALFAGLAAVLSVLGCVAISWADSSAYTSLSNTRLDGLVGNKGKCCTPGLKTACAGSGSFVCSSSGAVCDPSVMTSDACADPKCGDSDTRSDKCDPTLNFGVYTVSVATCSATSVAPIPCDGGL